MAHWKLGLGMIVLATSANGATSKLEAPSLTGQWAGDRMQMSADAGGARFELDCASGMINGPIKLSKAGKFVAQGSFEAHHPGPQLADEAAPANKARFSGEIKNGVMRLTMLAAGTKIPQVFQLKKGARIKLVRCL